jgi:gamma-glutamylcyclotransferase (GGCT)/AIG2-like uncharacterized protein YtfP
VEKSNIINSKSVMRNSWPCLLTTADWKEKFKELRERRSYTPDIPELEQRCAHLIFVYGSLKDPGFSRSGFLPGEGAKFIAAGTTKLNYSLWYQHRRKDAFPVLLPVKSGHPYGNVVGQVWMVYPHTIIKLDELERNTVLYNRLKINVQLITKPRDTQFQQYSSVYAYAYMGQNSLWGRMIDTLDLKPIGRTRIYDESVQNRYINWTPQMETKVNQ